MGKHGTTTAIKFKFCLCKLSKLNINCMNTCEYKRHFCWNGDKKKASFESNHAFIIKLLPITICFQCLLFVSSFDYNYYYLIINIDLFEHRKGEINVNILFICLSDDYK